MADIKSNVSVGENKVRNQQSVILRACDASYYDDQKDKLVSYVEYRILVNGIWCIVKPKDKTAREIMDNFLGRYVEAYDDTKH